MSRTTLDTAALAHDLRLAVMRLSRRLRTQRVNTSVTLTHLAALSTLLLSAAWQLFDATSMSLAEALRAAGDTAFTMWARVVIAWAIFVPGTLVTTRWFGGGDVAAAAWVVVYLALLAGTLAWRFRSGVWRKIDLTGAAAPPA